MLRMRFRPAVEALTDRVLLSQGLASLPWTTITGETVRFDTSTIPQPVIPPGSVPLLQYARPTPESVQVHLEADRTVYRLGQPVNLRLTATNISTDIVGVHDGCGGPASDFWVTRNGVEVYRYSQDPTLTWPLCAVSSAGTPFHPGQTMVATFTWQSAFRLAGDYVIHSSFNGVPTSSVTISFRNESALVLTVATDLKKYKLGQPVRITVTQTNISDGDVFVHESCVGPPGISVRNRQGQLVWQAPGVSFACPPSQFPDRRLASGESRTWTFTWNGQAMNDNGVPVTAGRYFIETGLVDGLMARTAIRLGRIKG